MRWIVLTEQKIQFHLVSFRYTEIAKSSQMISSGRHWPVYVIHQIPWLLMTLQCKEPGLQQPGYILPQYSDIDTMRVKTKMQSPWSNHSNSWTINKASKIITVVRLFVFVSVFASVPDAVACGLVVVAIDLVFLIWIYSTISKPQHNKNKSRKVPWAP